MLKINTAGLTDRRRRLNFPPTYRTENKEMNECWIFGPDSLTSEDFRAGELFSLFSLRENFHENNHLSPRAFYANEHQQRAAEDIYWYFCSHAYMKNHYEREAFVHVVRCSRLSNYIVIIIFMHQQYLWMQKGMRCTYWKKLPLWWIAKGRIAIYNVPKFNEIFIWSQET